MNVLLLGAAAWPRFGGIENSLLYLAQAIQRRGDSAKIVCFRKPADLPEHTLHQGIEIHRIPAPRQRIPHLLLRAQVDAAAQALSRIYQDFPPDLIWSRYHTMGMGAVQSGMSDRVTHVFPITARMAARDLAARPGAPGAWGRMKQRIQYRLSLDAQVRLERALIQQVQPVVFSQFMRERLMADYGAPPRPIGVIDPGVDTETFDRQSSSVVARLKEELGFASEDQVVLFVGRLAAYKNVGMLLDALVHLPIWAKLVVVGEGPMRVPLQKQMDALGLQERVRFVGTQQEQLATYYSLARVTAVPSIVESFGQVYLESFACGTPAVGFSSQLPECDVATEELIREGRNGRICHRFSASALAETIESVLEETVPTGEASIAIRADVLERYSWASTVSALMPYSRKVLTTP